MPAGTLIGKILVTDPDGDNVIIEPISDVELPFDIDSISGNIVVNGNPELDFEAKSTYVFIVKVTDVADKPLYNFASITVVLKDVVEIPADGMIAYYPLNGNAVDESVNSYHGIPFGAYGSQDRKGNENGAISFNGISDYINLSSLVGNGVRSISFWFRLDTEINGNLDKPVALLTREGDYNNYSEFSIAFVPYGLGWDGTPGKIRFLYSYNVSSYYYVQSNSSTWQKDKWYHVVALFDPFEGMKLYVDNVLQDDTKPYYTNATANSNLNTYVGSWATEPNRFFKGQIDELLFYKKALTEHEVDLLFHL